MTAQILSTGNSYFDEVFNGLPLNVRDRLADYWRKNPLIPGGQVPAIVDSPRISPFVIIQPDWGETGMKHYGPIPTLATTFAHGRMFVFDSKIFTWPKEVYQTIIAHELGHGYQWAGYNGPPIDTAKSERQVSKFMEQWGYRESTIDNFTGVLMPRYRLAA